MSKRKFFRTISVLSLALALIFNNSSSVFAKNALRQSVSSGDAVSSGDVVSGGDAQQIKPDDGTHYKDSEQKGSKQDNNEKPRVNSNDIAKIIGDSKTASAAVGKIAHNNTISDMRVAMQTDADVLVQVKNLEKEYMKEKHITVSKAVSEDVAKYVDENVISMIGAGFNAEEGDVCLDVSVPAKKEKINTKKYQKGIQLDIKLLHDGAEISDLIMPVTITMAVPAGLNMNKLVILHFDDKGGFENLDLKKNSDGTVTFTVTHFSTFVFAESDEVKAGEVSGTSATDTTDVPKTTSKATSPKTGSGMNNMLFVLLGISLLSGMAALVGKKKEKIC
ncbi:MAG: LPXTG cell wall anchor domain-containing protein [Lachnospiraceae bacterium]|nr:LPXTG cell wall anchor domain-containing protein [Lachnospiraceae bacterium]